MVPEGRNNIINLHYTTTGINDTQRWYELFIVIGPVSCDMATIAGEGC